MPTLPTAAGTAIPLGTAARRFGCSAVLPGDGVPPEGQGHFDAGAGAYTVTLPEDGVAVPVDIPATVRDRCRGSTSTLTLAATGATVPATVTIDDTAAVAKL